MRGRNLYNSKGRLGPLYYDARNQLVSAKVSSFSDHVYDSFVKLRSNGAPDGASCSCASFGQFKGLCKHVTALLLSLVGQDLPDEGLSPEIPEEESILNGVPHLNRPILSFEELLHIAGPAEPPKRRRGRPAKSEQPESELASSQTGQAGQPKVDLLTDNTVVIPAVSTETTDEYVRIFPGQMDRTAEADSAETAFSEPAEPLLPSGRRFLNRLFNWEERGQNLRRNSEILERQGDRLKLEITLEFLPGQAQNTQLSLRIGDEDHLYIVNQIGAFLSAIKQREKVVFGNYFTWEPPQRLTMARQLFFDWLEPVWKEENRQQRLRERRIPPDGKQLRLSLENLRSFLNLCDYCGDELPVTVRWDKEEFPLVMRRKLPQGLAIALAESQDASAGEGMAAAAPAAVETPAAAETAVAAKSGAAGDAGSEKPLSCELSLDYHGEKIPLAYLSDLHSAAAEADGVILLHPSGILLFDSVIYFCESQADLLMAEIMASLAEEKDTILTLDTTEMSYFLGSAHELLRDDKRLVWSDSLAKRLVEVPLAINVFVDSSGDQIFLSPFLVYGDYYFRPLMHLALPKTRDGKSANVLIVRDGKAEQAFENILKDWGFSQIELQDNELGVVTHGEEGDYLVNQFYIRGSEQVFRFVSETIHEVRQVAKVFVSPSFREIKVLEPSRPEVELNYADDSYISITIQMEGFADKDASRIVRFLQQKQSFARLADGSFVDLGKERKLSPAAEELRKLVETLTSWNAEWRQDHFVIPKYRGLALHGYLEDNQIVTKTDDERAKQAWENLIRDMENPASAAPELPPDVHASLRPYQVQGFQWLCFLERYDMGGILADEMGLGKTLQMLVFLYDLYLREPGPMLVIAPTSLLYNWLAEANRFVPKMPCQVIEGMKAQRTAQYETLANYKGLIIVSYGLARQDRRELREFPFQCIVLDEAQNIKNPMTKTTRAVKSLKTRRRFALTGTPLENHIGELWSIFDFIMPGYLFSYSTFQDRFGQTGQKSLSAEDGSVADEASDQTTQSLHQLVSPFILRRLKQEVLQDLPDKIITDIPCAMTPEQQQLYRKHLALARRQLNSFDSADHQEKNRKRMDILGELTRLRQICCDPALFVDGYTGGSGKREALTDLIENLLEGGHRILLFSQFTSMLQIIRKEQEELGRSVLYIDGQVPAKARLERVANFNSGEGDIFLISLRAGGTGLNLTGADVVIHYDPWWNPAVENQATDRAHRLGQRKVVQVFRMVTKGSIEEKIQELQQRKQALLDDIVSPGATFINRMDIDDIRGLFEDDLLTHEEQQMEKKL